MKLPFEVVDAMLSRLMDRLWEGKITVEQYNIEWDALLNFAGWSEADYLDCIDRGWLTEKKRSETFMC